MVNGNYTELHQSIGIKWKSIIRYFIRLFAILLVPFSPYAQANSNLKFVNPTGAYKLNSKTWKKDGELYGYTGEIKVKLLDDSKIAITLLACIGAPSYNIGTILDTLEYHNNISVYTTPEYDRSCIIKFKFNKSGITVEQHQNDLNWSCGFGHGVFAGGYYKKTSSKIPDIKNPAEN